MQTATKRELNQNTADVLDRAAPGRDVVITERGRPRWRVSRFDATQDGPLARLERDGRYQPPSPTPAPWPTTAGDPGYSDAEVDALLDETRGDH